MDKERKIDYLFCCFLVGQFKKKNFISFKQKTFYVCRAEIQYRLNQTALIFNFIVQYFFRNIIYLIKIYYFTNDQKKSTNFFKRKLSSCAVGINFKDVDENPYQRVCVYTSGIKNE